MMMEDRRKPSGPIRKDANLPSTPPRATEYEQALVGVLLHYPNAIDEVVGRVSAEMLFDDKCCLIYKTMVRLNDEGQPFDMVVIAKEVNGLIEGLGYYEVSKMADVGLLSCLGQYVNGIVGCYKRYRVWEAATSLARSCCTLDSDLDGAVELALATIHEAVDGALANEMVALREVYDDVKVTMEKNRANPDGARGFLVGIPEVDEYGGLSRGTFNVVAGRTSNGKSALTMQWVMLNARMGLRTAVFSLEMTADRLASRVLAGESGVSGNRILTKALSDGELASVCDAIDQDNRSLVSDCVMLDSRTSSVDQICSKIRRMHHSGKIDAAVIDYLQLMDKSDKSRDDNEVRILGEMAHRLQRLSVELDIPVIVTSQMNRNAANSSDGVPRLSDLRGSGAIEEAADNIIIVYRPEADNSGRSFSGQYADVDPHNTALLMWVKSRNGVSGRHFFFDFDPARVMFSYAPQPRQLGAGRLFRG